MTYYGIYRITNLTNGKMYIGKHKTDNLDDGYMGSGTIIKRVVKKYGVQNFRKEWLMFCEDEEEMDYMERVFVDQTWVDRSDTYNLIVGGCGNPPVKGRRFSEQALENYRKAGLRRRGRKMSKESSEKKRKAMLGRKFTDEHKRRIGLKSVGNKYFLGKHHTDEWRQMMSQKLKGRKFSEETIKRMSEARKRVIQRNRVTNEENASK